MSANQLFVIYNVDTMKLVKARSGQTTFPRQSVARTVRTKLRLDTNEWKVDTYDNWAEIDAQTEIEVISMMTQQPVKIRKSQRGNPASDPSMEGHWTA